VVISVLAITLNGSEASGILSGVEELRRACAAVAEQAAWVRVEADRIESYAAGLPLDAPRPGAGDALSGSREHLAAYWLTLDAINFGSGWFPTLRKREGRSGYNTIAAGLREAGPWSARELVELDAASVARVVGQEPGHELMELFAVSLGDLGRRVIDEGHGRFVPLVDEAGGSAVALASRLGGWNCFADVSCYGGLRVPFLKRAQIAAADLARAGVAVFEDLNRLTMFADNLVPHVLRLDGVLRFDPGLVARIERGDLIEHGSPEEVEIRACAVHAVELIVAARSHTCAAEVDQLLWLRGQQPHYKAVPRHRSRCTAY
jgi:hypothetical protein